MRTMNFQDWKIRDDQILILETKSDHYHWCIERRDLDSEGGEIDRRNWGFDERERVAAEVRWS